MFTLIFLTLVTTSTFYLVFKSIKSIYDFRRLMREGVIAKGIITDFKTIKNRDSESYQPIIQFKTYSSLEVVGSPMFNYDTDEYVDAPKDVEVIYLEASPKIFITSGQKISYKPLLAVAITLVINFFAIKILVGRDPNWLNDLKHLFDWF
ncbi:DUF3592 domain-containing protein [Emticicia sp. C21]|uniref:DUF3592 domain-containing protein n=1 Tax=Emticicia sp. C21 TaxID=2302915 RepID=UPI000E34BDAC|nr:DUF3592 domain-containing protein [Emticicia sp. C21]RFS18530.1 hypothetical protein D0T08_04580 [Emticicia sp. C21]